VGNSLSTERTLVRRAVVIEQRGDSEVRERNDILVLACGMAGDILV